MQGAFGKTDTVLFALVFEERRRIGRPLVVATERSEIISRTGSEDEISFEIVLDIDTTGAINRRVQIDTVILTALILPQRDAVERAELVVKTGTRHVDAAVTIGHCTRGGSVHRVSVPDDISGRLIHRDRTGVDVNQAI